MTERAFCTHLYL